MTGSDLKKGGLEYVVSRIKFSDKLIVRLSLADTSARANPELLTRFAHDFSDSLSRRFDSSYIKSIIGNVTDSALSSSIELLYGHLPIYLDDNDYSHIDSMLNAGAIHSAIERDYRNLLTPAGFGLKKNILRDPLGLTYLAMKKLKSLQAGEQFDIVDGFILTKDMKNLLLFVTPANPASETNRNQKLVDGIDELLGKVNGNYNHLVRGQYFGAIAFATGNARQIKKDIYLTLIIALTLILALIGWYFKSWKIPLLGFLPALFGGGLALAILYLIKGTVSAIALGIGSVILGLIVDYALYIINHFRKKGDMVVVLKEMTLTIVLCSLTTAGAFLCLIFLRSAVLHDLGWFAALSVAGAAFFSLVILPHFLGEKDLKASASPKNPVNRMGSFAFEKSPVFIGLLVIISVGAIFFVSRVKFEDDMMALNFVPDKLKNMEKELDRITNAAFKTVYIVSTGKDLNEALLAGERKAQEIDGLLHSGVIRSISGCRQLLFSDSVQIAKIRQWAAFWNPQRRNLLEQNIRSAAKEFRFRDTAFDEFLELPVKDFNVMDAREISQVTTGLLSDYITETSDLAMVTSVAKVKQEDKEQLYRTLKGKPNLVVFDKQLLANAFVANVKQDFDLLVRLSMIFVTLLLLLSFGRIETGLVAALPMYLSWLMTLGFMGITGIRFNIFNIIVSSFIFGLGVDYSILMMRGLLFEYTYGTKEIASYKTSILLSSLTTLFGVGALFFALHPALNSIAAISVFGIVAVVLVSYTFQPLLLRWFLINRLSVHKHPITLRIFIKTFITWGNIVLIAIHQVVLGGLIFLLAPVPKKTKQYVFHWMFSQLCKAYIFITFPTNRKFYNPYGEDFSKPAVIIANHQSLIETPLFLRLHPKILILTNEWVWRSPLWGPVARMASFFNAENGIDSILGQLQEMVSKGYSILIFPEAHRYNDYRVHRFHRGAFYLAEKLQIDLLPIVVFGTGDFLGRGIFWGRFSGVRMKILQRVGPGDTRMGTGYSERSKRFRKFLGKEYSTLMAAEGTGRYWRKKLLLNFTYKGPVLEWYLRVKLRIENYYQPYNELLPREGEILDLGCGYGFMSYMLSLTSPLRKITGVDYDAEKIRVALNGYLKNDNLEFICDDITKYSFSSKDAIVLSDVLHYLPEEKQEALLNRCIDNLRPGGMILIREADSDVMKEHRRTKLTELLSTQIVGFNKTAGDLKELHFTSRENIRSIVEQRGLKVEVVHTAKHTSNVLMIIRK
ncbi:MAG: methyltransferase domain-containing protein [Bacteroidetes bacterium]|nr:methyltransferase domain-containing protein [Bacteroidota bacterium]